MFIYFHTFYHCFLNQAVSNNVLAKRVNTPPKAIVQPVMQAVNLPTTKAIIDGSGSQDDTTDLKFKWEILNGPVNYQNELPSEPTLTLVDLVSQAMIGCHISMPL